MNIFGGPDYKPYLSGIDTSTGPKGEIANADLIAHSEMFEPEVIEVTKGIYNQIGVGLATTTLIGMVLFQRYL